MLVIFGAATRGGFEAMVAYTAPVFWFFMMLVAISIYVFRSRETGEVTHYRVPLYPVTPAILALTCLLDALFEPRLCRLGIDHRRGDPAARHAAVVPEAKRRLGASSLGGGTALHLAFGTEPCPFRRFPCAG